MASVYVVDLACLACGRERQVVVARLTELPELPARCERCRGSVLAVSTTARAVRPAVSIVWSDERRPRRGRPPAHAQQMPLLELRGGGEATA